MFNENEVMTLTHCRFDARAKYGIQKIIVVDTDEFLFCGFPKSIDEARRNIDSMIETYSDAGHTEISFQQRAPCSRNVLGQGFGLIECAKAAIIRNAIVLGCYSSSDFFLDQQGHKTLHLGFHCPFTSYHEGCRSPLPDEEPFFGSRQGFHRDIVNLRMYR